LLGISAQLENCTRAAPAVDRAGAAAEGAALIALYSVRSIGVLRAARLQLAVPLVSRHGMDDAGLDQSNFSACASAWQHDIGRRFFEQVIRLHAASSCSRLNTSPWTRRDRVVGESESLKKKRTAPRRCDAPDGGFSRRATHNDTHVSAPTEQTHAPRWGSRRSSALAPRVMDTGKVVCDLELTMRACRSP